MTIKKKLNKNKNELLKYRKSIVFLCETNRQKNINMSI